MSDRYGKEYYYGDVAFRLEDFMPHEEQCRILMLKVLEQAVRDYCALADSDLPNEQLLWETTRGFLYDDDYFFMWGDLEVNLEAFLDIIDLDIDWVREQTTRKFNERNKKKWPRKKKR